MARSYPRFVFSDPKNDAGEGPFIVHCLYPRLIIKVIRSASGKLELIPIDKNIDQRAQKKILKDAIYWLIAQIKEKQFSVDTTTDIETLPKFLFAHPQNTKRAEPIDIHTGEPMIIYRAEKFGFTCKCIPLAPDDYPENNNLAIRLAATDWLCEQIVLRKVTL